MDTPSTGVIDMANDTTYGLASGVLTQVGTRATRVAHALEAGTAWVRHIVLSYYQNPF